jgi:hypothetical protein
MTFTETQRMTQPQDQSIAVLTERLEHLERRLTETENIHQIERLTRAYGYYLDKALWDEALALFTDDCSVEISALGIYVGKKQAGVLFKDLLGKGPALSDDNGLVWGRLYNHMIVQGIVNVDDDGRGASGRWRCFMQIAEFGKSAVWGEGPYEIRYRKGDDDSGESSGCTSIVPTTRHSTRDGRRRSRQQAACVHTCHRTILHRASMNLGPLYTYRLSTTTTRFRAVAGTRARALKTYDEATLFSPSRLLMT